jgi:hypothetical protein
VRLVNDVTMFTSFLSALCVSFVDNKPTSSCLFEVLLEGLEGDCNDHLGDHGLIDSSGL